MEKRPRMFGPRGRCGWPGTPDLTAKGVNLHISLRCSPGWSCQSYQTSSSGSANYRSPKSLLQRCNFALDVGEEIMSNGNGCLESERRWETIGYRLLDTGGCALGSEQRAARGSDAVAAQPRAQAWGGTLSSAGDEKGEGLPAQLSFPGPDQQNYFTPKTPE